MMLHTPPHTHGALQLRHSQLLDFPDFLFRLWIMRSGDSGGRSRQWFSLMYIGGRSSKGCWWWNVEDYSCIERNGPLFGDEELVKWSLKGPKMDKECTSDVGNEKR